MVRVPPRRDTPRRRSHGRRHAGHAIRVCRRRGPEHAAERDPPSNKSRRPCGRPAPRAALLTPALRPRARLGTCHQAAVTHSGLAASSATLGTCHRAAVTDDGPAASSDARHMPAGSGDSQRPCGLERDARHMPPGSGDSPKRIAARWTLVAQPRQPRAPPTVGRPLPHAADTQPTLHREGREGAPSGT